MNSSQQKKAFEEASSGLSKEDILKLFENCLSDTFEDDPWQVRWENACKAGRLTLSYQSPDEIQTHHDYAENDPRLSEAPTYPGDDEIETSTGLTAFREITIRTINFAVTSGQPRAVIILYAACVLKHPMYQGKSFEEIGKLFKRTKQQMHDLWKRLAEQTGLRWPHAQTEQQRKVCSERNYRA